MGFKEMVQLWYDMGVFDVVLPLLLVTSVTYGLLQRTKVLGEKSQRYNIAISLIIGLMIVAAVSIVGTLQTIVQYSALGLLLIIFAVIIMKFAGAKDITKHNFPVYVGLVVIAIISFYSLGFTGSIPWRTITEFIIPLLVVIAIIFIAVYAIVRPSAEEKKKTKKSVIDESVAEEFTLLKPEELEQLTEEEINDYGKKVLAKARKLPREEAIELMRKSGLVFR
jgi:hypothetical protein